MNPLEHVRILKRHGLAEMNLHFQHLPVSDTFACWKAVVVLEHAHDILTHISPQIPLCEALIRQKENTFRNCPDRGQRLIAAKIFGGSKSVTEPIQEFRTHTLRRERLALARSDACEHPAQIRKISELWKRQQTLVIAVPRDHLHDLGGSIWVLEAERPILLSLRVFPDDDRLSVPFSLQCIHLGSKNRPIMQYLASVLLSENETPSIVSPHDRNKTCSSVLPCRFFAQRVQLPSVLLLVLVLHIHLRDTASRQAPCAPQSANMSEGAVKTYSA
mmetsp:Transcript_43324/g.114027  ORF Transcript_43324/g.114027 Transcript_43324/m.114027 type:complete len:274 (-) Transcript_43324:7-828(-)